MVSTEDIMFEMKWARPAHLFRLQVSVLYSMYSTHRLPI